MLKFQRGPVAVFGASSSCVGRGLVSRAELVLQVRVCFEKASGYVELVRLKIASRNDLQSLSVRLEIEHDCKRIWIRFAWRQTVITFTNKSRPL